jgi:hypothetical protein
MGGRSRRARRRRPHALVRQLLVGAGGGCEPIAIDSERDPAQPGVRPKGQIQSEMVVLSGAHTGALGTAAPSPDGSTCTGQ